MSRIKSIPELIEIREKLKKGGVEEPLPLDTMIRIQQKIQDISDLLEFVVQLKKFVNALSDEIAFNGNFEENLIAK